jgi:hypothetical protein
MSYLSSAKTLIELAQLAATYHVLWPFLVGLGFLSGIYAGRWWEQRRPW